MTLAELLSQPNMSSVLSGAEFARSEEMFGYEFMPVEALDSVVSEVSLALKIMKGCDTFSYHWFCLKIMQSQFAVNSKCFRF